MIFLLYRFSLTRRHVQSVVGLKDSLEFHPETSGDSGMYPYQRTPMGNPYIRPI